MMKWSIQLFTHCRQQCDSDLAAVCSVQQQPSVSRGFDSTAVLLMKKRTCRQNWEQFRPAGRRKTSSRSCLKSLKRWNKAKSFNSFLTCCSAETRARLLGDLSPVRKSPKQNTVCFWRRNIKKAASVSGRFSSAEARVVFHWLSL